MTTLEKVSKGLIFLENIDKNLTIERGDECILIAAPDEVNQSMIDYLLSLGFQYKYDTFQFYL